MCSKHTHNIMSISRLTDFTLNATMSVGSPLWENHEHLMRDGVTVPAEEELGENLNLNVTTLLSSA